jgi:predicted nucleotidyltransferase
MKNQTDIEKIKKITSGTLNAEGIDTFEIYLFGSRARGDFSSHSDYDIMIVLDKRLAMKKKIKLFTKLRRELAKKKYNVDIVIKSADEVNYYKNKIGHIVRSALREGLVI